MNEKTRQLILLTGIMSILIAGLIMFVAVNSNNQNTDADNQEKVEVSNNNEQKQEPISNESKDIKNNSDDKISPSEMNIIQQSVHGLEELWKDMISGWGTILSLTDTDSSN